MPDNKDLGRQGEWQANGYYVYAKDEGGEFHQTVCATWLGEDKDIRYDAPLLAMCEGQAQQIANEHNEHEALQERVRSLEKEVEELQWITRSVLPLLEGVEHGHVRLRRMMTARLDPHYYEDSADDALKRIESYEMRHPQYWQKNPTP